MQPLTQLPTEDCQRLVGVAFDIDDTVTHDGRLEAEAFASMWRLRHAGLHLVAVTGRPLGWTDVIARQWPVDVAVGENGAGWSFTRGKRVHEGYLEGPAERQARQAKLDEILRHVRQEFPQLPLASDQPARRCDLAFDIGETHELAPQDRRRLVALVESLGARCPVSSVHAHVVLGRWNKALGVVAAVEAALNLDVAAHRERWMFVGDSGNDAEAFAYFPLSVGVANVKNHLANLPVPPAYVSNAPRGRGFAEISAWLLAQRPPVGSQVP